MKSFSLVLNLIIVSIWLLSTKDLFAAAPVGIGAPSKTLSGSVIPSIGLPSNPAGLPIEVIRPEIRMVYAPVGFDDNDVVQFVVEGQFKNNCYTAFIPPVQVDHMARRIYFDVYAYRYKGCEGNSVTAWNHVIEVPGFLNRGRYSLYRQAGGLQNPEPSFAGSLSIAHTESLKRDDYIYAPVSSFILNTPRNSQSNRQIVLDGHFENSCTEFDLNLTSISQTDNVIVIRPITKQNDKNCSGGETHFSQEIDIPAHIPAGRYLYHVRTKDGHSFNRISFLSAGH